MYSFGFIAPVLALVAWSLVVWTWMYATRLPAMQKVKIDPQTAKHPGSLDVLPSGARQVADNYNHLMEQPTIFYATALALGALDAYSLTSISTVRPNKANSANVESEKTTNRSGTTLMVFWTKE